MNKYQQFIKGKPFGFLNKQDLAELILLDRLCPCLIRCEMGRFTCAAQDVAHFVHVVEKGGEHVRDVAMASGYMDRAALWQSEPARITDRFDTHVSKTTREKIRDKFKSFHRQARLGNLGPLAMSVSNSLYGWLLHEVYDPRFPHVGDDRHAMRDRIANFGRTAGKTQNAFLAALRITSAAG